MRTPDFIKLNKVITSSIQKGEREFYNTILEQIDYYLQAISYLIKPANNKTLKVFPDNDSRKEIQFPLQSMDIDLSSTQTPQVKRIVLNKFKDYKLGKNTQLDKIQNSKVIVKTIQSANTGVPTGVLIVEKSPTQNDFDDRDNKLLDYFTDLLSTPLSLFDADRKIKLLAQKNSTLNKLATYHFPNSKYPISFKSDKKKYDCVYMIMDIRNSSSLNEYIISKTGIHGVSEFYKNYKEYCDNIAVLNHQSWFRRQIGDRMDYAWKSADKKKAVLAAIDILDNIQHLRRKSKLPLDIGIGIGISRGETWPDYDINELKGEPARIANELQEKHFGIFLDFKPHKSLETEIKKKGWIVIHKSLITRKTMSHVWEIRKKGRRKINIFHEDTIEQLKYSGRLFGDNHIHLEGVDLKEIDFIELFVDSAKVANRNTHIKKQIELVTNMKLETIVDDFLSSISDEGEDETFSFNRFLTKMYATKLVLASNYKLAEKFVYKTLKNYFSKYWFIRLSIVPSLPIDFPHLDPKRWNTAIIRALESALDENNGSKMELVVETKRQHLSEKANGSYIYQHNFRFLEELESRDNADIQLSISICDDASLYPLFESTRLAQFEDYLDTLKQHNSVTLSIHMLETLPNLKVVSRQHKQILKSQPTYELTVVLDLLKKKKISGVTFIHMCNLFAGAPISKADRTEEDKLLVKMGMSHLRQIIRRQDKIVLCYSSNKHLQNPFLLEYPEIIKSLLNGEINITLGTDDPGPFKVLDVAAEMRNLVNHIKATYPEGLKLSQDEYYSAEELAILIRFALIRNSWRKWNHYDHKWEQLDVKYLTQMINYDTKAFHKALHFDICKIQTDLKDKSVRAEIIKREKTNFFEF